MPFDFFMARARREKLPKASTRPEAPAAAEGVYGIITCVKVTSAGTRGTLEDAELHLSANRGISPISKKTHRYNTVYHYAIDPEV